MWKKGQALIPTWTAFAVVGLLEQHFDELVDYAFTAKVETDLDAIAAGQQRKDAWLHDFYFGEDPDSDDALPGLKRLVEENLDSIDAAAINTFPIGHDADGNLVVVKPGRYGPYVKRGEDTAGVPDDLPPDELTIDVAAFVCSPLPKRTNRSVSSTACRCSPRTVATARMCSWARLTLPRPVSTNRRWPACSSRCRSST